MMKAFTALTMGKVATVGAVPASGPIARLSPTPVREPQSDVLFEMFNGALGGIHLGRLLKGHDAGRLVTLRKLRGAISTELAVATDLARSIAHPKLVKVLGMVSEPDATYLASEHIFGVTLFELGRTASNRQLAVLPNVAVRIVLDALLAADAAQRLLTETLGSHPVRIIDPECVWIADFGETFVAEVLLAPLLAQASKSTTWHAELDVGAADVRVAALELVRMTCAGLSADDPLHTDLSALPDELQAVLTQALGHGSMVGYADPRAFSDALLDLDESLVATEEQVGQELRRLMGTVLNVRRQKLDMLERNAVPDYSEEQGDETKFFRHAAKTEQRDTTRPPPEPAPAGSSASTLAAVKPSSQKPTAVSAHPAAPPSIAPEPLDEPTQLFLREARSVIVPHDALWHLTPPTLSRRAQEKLERNEPTQISRSRLVSGQPSPARGRSLVQGALFAVAVMTAIAATRLAWLAHSSRSTVTTVLQGDAGAVKRTWANILP